MISEEGYRIIVEVKGDPEALAKELKGSPEIVSVEVNGKNVSVRASNDIRTDIVRVASKKGIEILSIRRLEPSLEDIFMKQLSRRRP